MVNINAGNPWAHAARQRLNTNSLDDWLLKSHINCNLSIGNVCLPDIRGGYGLALASFAPGRRSDMRECRNAKTGARTTGAESCRSGSPPPRGTTMVGGGKRQKPITRCGWHA